MNIISAPPLLHKSPLFINLRHSVISKCTAILVPTSNVCEICKYVDTYNMYNVFLRTYVIRNCVICTVYNCDTCAYVCLLYVRGTYCTVRHFLSLLCSTQLCSVLYWRVTSLWWSPKVWQKSTLCPTSTLKTMSSVISRQFL